MAKFQTTSTGLPHQPVESTYSGQVTALKFFNIRRRSNGKLMMLLKSHKSAAFCLDLGDLLMLNLFTFLGKMTDQPHFNIRRARGLHSPFFSLTCKYQVGMWPQLLKVNIEIRPLWCLFWFECRLCDYSLSGPQNWPSSRAWFGKAEFATLTRILQFDRMFRKISCAWVEAMTRI